MAARRVGVFGGTFDPVHEGHLHVADHCRKAAALDLVIFMPCRRSPHKDDAPVASDSDRLHMLSLSVAGLPWALVSTLEVDRPPPSFSWTTAEALREVYPNSALFWLMGSDQWEALPAWDRPEHLAELVDFVVFHRGGEPPSLPGFEAHFVAGDHPAAATHIRSALARGGAPQWLDGKVEQFIAQRGLYQGKT